MNINASVKSMIIKLTGMFHEDQMYHKVEVRDGDDLVARVWFQSVGEERILKFATPQRITEINSINDFEVVIEEGELDGRTWVYNAHGGWLV